MRSVSGVTLVLVAGALMAAVPARAGTCDFTGTGNWGAASNWTCSDAPLNRVPTTTDTATVAGKTVDVSSDESVGDLSISNGATINFTAAKTIAVAGLTSADGNFTADGSDSIVDNVGGGSKGAVTVAQNFGKTGTLASDQLSLTSVNLTLNDPTPNVNPELQAGSICVGSGASVEVTTQFTVGSGGNVNASPFNCAGGTLQVDAGGTLAFASTSPAQLAVATPVSLAGTLALASPQDVDFGGSVAVSTGTMTIPSGATAGGNVALTGGVLTGGGTVSGNVTNNGGTVRPGGSPGTLSIGGNFSQGAGGTLETDIDGTTAGAQFDVLHVGGGLDLGGTVHAILGGGFSPGAGDSFQVVVSRSAAGTQTATLTGLGGYAVVFPTKSPFGARLVRPQKPANTGQPQISGTAAVGQQLTCSEGAWDNFPTQFAFQWLIDGQPASGANGNTFQVVDAEAGHQISCRVTASNSSGATDATSDAVSIPASAPPNVAPPGGTSPTATPTPTVPPTPETRLAQATSSRVATAIGLPSARRCVSRPFTVRFRQPSGVQFKTVTVRVGGHVVRVRRTGTHYVAVDRRALPKGSFTVRIDIVGAAGSRIRAVRVYRACALKKTR